MTKMQKLTAFIRLGRPLFLGGGLIFHLLGVLMALYAGADLNLAVLIWGQVAITGAQLMTHYGNEYYDLEADRANPNPTHWAGGSRVLVEGWLPPRVALAAARVFGVLSLAATLVLGVWFQASWQALAVLLLSVFLAWEYSAPPLKLHSRGLGELTVAVIVPVLTPLTGYTLQAGQLAVLPLLVVFPLACLQFVMILGINFPDAAGDWQTDKYTLVIRLGAARAARLYLFVLALAYLSLPLLRAGGVPLPAVLAVLALSPLAAWQAYRMGRGDWKNPPAWDSLAFWSIALLMGTAVLVVLAFGWLVFG
jgi:1,4-dihydroxy-2-naphthoate octaprenyltransferase